MGNAHDVRIVVAAAAILGEGPVWDSERACLWFVDIKAHTLHCYHPARDQRQHWAAPAQIGWALPTTAGDLLCGLADGLYRFDVSSGRFTHWLAIEPDMPGNRLNDACADAAGRVWFGSMDDGEAAPTGAFYRLAHGQVDAVGPAAVPITNGPSLSPDGRTIYFTDTLARRIWQAPVDAAGGVGASALFFQFTDEAGHPDGSTVDAAGNVWTGMYGGGGAWCIAPTGAKIAFVALPARNITKLAFGGADLKTVYATSATKGMTAAQRAADPAAGHVFAFDVPVPGCLAHRAAC